MKYIGIKSNRINIVSDQLFTSNDLSIINIPEYLQNVSKEDLLINYKIRNNEIVKKTDKIPTSELRVAFVNNWKMQCGISTYSENLIPQIVPKIADYKLFTEYNSTPTPSGQISSSIKEDRIVECWRRGEKLTQLLNEINAYNPDVVLIQHEFGLFPNARYWISFITQLKKQFKVVVTMHSVFHHQDKTICEALLDDVVVHLPGAKQVLKEEKKISGNVHVIPHGCYPILNKSKLWNFYKTNNNFLQVGFGFRYKGFTQSIEAVSKLKIKYPDVFLTIIFSESPFCKLDHETYLYELYDLIEKLGVEENVGIIRGFQSDEVMDSYFRTNKAAVFPYQETPGHQVFGATGAARLAFSKNIATITSSIPHFSDVPSIKANFSDEIAKELDSLFSDKSNIDKQLVKQEEYVKENSWENIADKYLEIM